MKRVKMVISGKFIIAIEFNQSLQYEKWHILCTNSDSEGKNAQISTNRYFQQCTFLCCAKELWGQREDIAVVEANKSVL